MFSPNELISAEFLPDQLELKCPIKMDFKHIRNFARLS